MSVDPSDQPIVAVNDLHFSYLRGGAVVSALRGVSLAVQPGEAVGIVGESGSGKSTLARALLGLTNPHLSRIEAGRIFIDGKDVTGFGSQQWESLRGHPVAMMFQDPLTYLNPVMKVGRQIAESVRRHDRGADVGARVRELLGLVRLPESIAKSYAHELSGGMRQRALLAVALGCRPQLLVADEPTTALDVTTQTEIMALLADLRQRLGMAILLISHDLGLVASACTRIYVMYAGRTVEWGSTASVFAESAHPYTAGLLQSARVVRNEAGRFATIGGDVPNLAQPIEGCPFRPRCAFAFESCVRMPEPIGVSADRDHEVRCWFVEEQLRSAAEAARVG
ncbi:MAG: ABC transporter ATP-binding protein [Caldimonas sp.]